MAKDRFHDVVKTALLKDGWTITHDPLKVKAGGISVEIDLGAEHLLAADRNDEKIAVEIKSFLVTGSAISQFHLALGQFINYRAALRLDEDEDDRILYLAIPDLTYNGFFNLELPALMLEENDIKLIVYNIEMEEIVQWKS